VVLLFFIVNYLVYHTQEPESMKHEETLQLELDDGKIFLS
jgi:hypothetical protein